MQDYERYITVQEAAKRLGRPEPEILRMLETGALPAMLRAELASKDGTPIGFDFARLPPEGVARVVDQGGDDFTLEWQYCGGHGKAVCFPARESSIRVLWEPSLFPELMPQPKEDTQSDVGMKAEDASVGHSAKGTPPALTAEEKAEIARRFRNRESVNRLAQAFNVHNRTIDAALMEFGLKNVKPRKGRKAATKIASITA